MLRPVNRSKSPLAPSKAGVSSLMTKQFIAFINICNAIKQISASPQFAIKNRFRHRSKAFPKREHWLDWASEKYDVSTVWALLCPDIPWPSASLLSVLIHCLKCWANSFGALHRLEASGLAKPQCSPGIAGYHPSSHGRKQSCVCVDALCDHRLPGEIRGR